MEGEKKVPVCGIIARNMIMSNKLKRKSPIKLDLMLKSCLNKGNEMSLIHLKAKHPSVAVQFKTCPG